MDANEKRIYELMEGVKQGKHVNNKRCQSCANFRVRECSIDFLTKKFDSNV